MTLIKQLRSKADQVTLEADKVLRINRKQGEIGQFNRQIDQLTARLGQTAYGLHKQGQVLTPELVSICNLIDALHMQIRQAEQEIERIRLETLAVDSVPDGITCPVCNAVIPSVALFCPNCGSQQPKPPPMVRCQNCGNSMPAEARFCAQCGQPVESSAPRAVASTTTTASGVSTVTDDLLDVPTVERIEYPSELPEVDQPADVASDDAMSITEPVPEPYVPTEYLEPAPVDVAVAAETKVCTNCESEIPVESVFCPLCGTPIQRS